MKKLFALLTFLIFCIAGYSQTTPTWQQTLNAGATAIISKNVILTTSGTFSVNSSGLYTIASPSLSITGANLKLAGLSGLGAGKFLTTDASGNTSWGNAGGVTSVSADSPLSSSGGATPTITITSPLPVANGGTNTTISTGTGSVVLSASPALTGVVSTQSVSVTGNVSITGQSYIVPTTLTYTTAITWDLNTSAIATLTLTASAATVTPSNVQAGGTYDIQVVQDGTGSRTMGWASTFKFPSGILPTLTTTAGAKDIFRFVSFDGTNLMLISGSFDVK